MTERYIEAAINGANGSNESYFFLGDQYVTYNWTADRAADGVRPASDWGIPASFTPPPELGAAPEPAGLDAAVKGRASFLDKAYFFKDTQYMRSVFAPRGPDAPGPLDISIWKLPGLSFAGGVDAIFNGRGSRDGKGYFFRGAEYNRYDWDRDEPDLKDPNGLLYPRPINNMLGMPSDFATGVDAAVDGDGSFAGFGYIFRGQSYLRFKWTPPGGGEPHVDKPSAPIQPNWPGLVELLFAGLGKSKALIWVRAAQDSLGQFLGGTLSAGDVGLIGTALSVHFHISSASSLENRTLINQILTTYGLIADALNQSPVKFRFRSDAEANADLAGGSGFDAYTFFGGTMNFTKLFPQRRRLARAAIILHEAVHAVDNDSGRQTPTGALAVDIPEWYVTDAEAERLGLPIQANRSDLGARYDTLSAADAIHNPSAYSAFAQHVSMGSDVRFGSVNQGPE